MYCVGISGGATLGPGSALALPEISINTSFVYYNPCVVCKSSGTSCSIIFQRVMFDFLCSHFFQIFQHILDLSIFSYGEKNFSIFWPSLVINSGSTTGWHCCIEKDRGTSWTTFSASWRFVITYNIKLLMKISYIWKLLKGRW